GGRGDPPGVRAALARCRATRRPAGRGGVRAAGGHAPELRDRGRSGVPSRHRAAAHAQRRLHRARWRTDHRRRTTDTASRRFRSFPRAMIRTLWFYLVLVVSSVVHSVGVIDAALLGVKRRAGGGGVYDWGTNDWSRQVLRAAGTPVRVEGLERIPSGPVVYASNHSSMFDIWALAATLPGSVRMVAKQELARIPLLGRAMVTAGHLTIDRAHPARALAAYP